jgi:signal transduction histidine kinase/phage shock protein PspC (stress-responsive transcriptional regulator)
MPATAATPGLSRDPQDRVVAGVCSGLARRLGVDPLLVRVAFIAGGTAGGAGVIAYLIAWVLLPAEPGAPARLRTGRGAVEVAIGTVLLALALLMALRASGWWFSDAIAWPLALVAGGVALLWRGAVSAPVRPVPPVPPAAAAATAPTAAATAPAQAPAGSAPDVGAVSRTGVGAALVIAAGLVFLQATGALGAARDVALAALVVAIVLGLIFLPWTVRLVRSLTAERAERIRSQERAELAAHLHDSVLQTLALVQRRSDDPRAVAALARRQERELRAWLAGRTAAEGADRRLVAALEAAADDVEEQHGVPVEVVAVGDVELDEAGEAVIAAAREAMVNAAKFGGGGTVAVYAEAGPERVQVFVRDRGPGFDTAAVPADRRGVRESIVGRMERFGGRAAVHSAPGGGGTEVELVLERQP